jgi:hypothetical protein
MNLLLQDNVKLNMQKFDNEWSKFHKEGIKSIMINFFDDINTLGYIFSEKAYSEEEKKEYFRVLSPYVPRPILQEGLMTLAMTRSNPQSLAMFGETGMRNMLLVVGLYQLFKSPEKGTLETYEKLYSLKGIRDELVPLYEACRKNCSHLEEVHSLEPVLPVKIEGVMIEVGITLIAMAMDIVTNEVEETKFYMVKVNKYFYAQNYEKIMHYNKNVQIMRNRLRQSRYEEYISSVVDFSHNGFRYVFQLAVKGMKYMKMYEVDFAYTMYMLDRCNPGLMKYLVCYREGRDRYVMSEELYERIRSYWHRQRFRILFREKRATIRNDEYWNGLDYEQYSCGLTGYFSMMTIVRDYCGGDRRPDWWLSEDIDFNGILVGEVKFDGLIRYGEEFEYKDVISNSLAKPMFPIPVINYPRIVWNGSKFELKRRQSGEDKNRRIRVQAIVQNYGDDCMILRTKKKEFTTIYVPGEMTMVYEQWLNEQGIHFEYVNEE